MRAYCRPGATPIEQLEAHLAFQMHTRPQVTQRVADLLAWATNSGPAREETIRDSFSQGTTGNPAEALGMARAVLFLCGVAPENGDQLYGHPRLDFARLLEGEFRRQDLASPRSYALPSLLEAYSHMGAGFARGVDRVFQAATGQPLSEHLRRALSLLESPA